MHHDCSNQNLTDFITIKKTKKRCFRFKNKVYLMYSYVTRKVGVSSRLR